MLNKFNNIIFHFKTGRKVEIESFKQKKEKVPHKHNVTSFDYAKWISHFHFLHENILSKRISKFNRVWNSIKNVFDPLVPFKQGVWKEKREKHI